MMAPIRLPCLVGGDCNFQTVQLEFEQAKPLLDGHMQYAQIKFEFNLRALLAFIEALIKVRCISLTRCQGSLIGLQFFG